MNENAYKRHIETHQSSSSNISTSTSNTPTSIQLWPCNVCATVFANEFGNYPYNYYDIIFKIIFSHLPTGLLSHLEQMKSDPKHQFETQIILNYTNASDKKINVSNFNLLANNLSVISNGSLNESANMIAHNILHIAPNAITTESNNRSTTNVTTTTLNVDSFKYFEQIKLESEL